MVGELKERLSAMAERGEWRGADTIMASVRAILDPTRALLSAERRRHPAWMYALGAAALTIALIGGGALLFLGSEEEAPPVTSLVTTSPVPVPTTTGTTVPVDTSEGTVTTTRADTTTVAPTTTAGPAHVGTLAWARVPFGAEGSPNSVIEGGPGLIAGGTSGLSAAIWTSADGLVWEPVPHNEEVFGAGAYAIADLAAGPDGYVAVGGGGVHQEWGPRRVAIWRSTDGVTWEKIALDEAVVGVEGYLSIGGIAYGPAGYVVVGWEAPEDEPWMLGEHYVLRSADGRTWERVDLANLPLGGMGDVVAAGPGYVAVGVDWRDRNRSSPGVWTSADGLTWALADSADVPRHQFGGDIQAMDTVGVSAEGYLVAVGSTSTRVIAWGSVDGLTWTALPLVTQWESSEQGGWFATGVALSGRQIVIAGGRAPDPNPDPGLGCLGPPGSGLGMVWVSDDGGTTWNQASGLEYVFGDSSGAVLLNDLVEIDGGYVAVGYWNEEAVSWLAEEGEGKGE